MQLTHYTILPPLQPFIKLICTMDCEGDTDTCHITVLPDACVELFVNYSTTPLAIIDHEIYHQSIVSARMTRPISVQMRKGAGCIAVCFYPGMAHRFFNVAMHELTDKNTSLNDLWKGLTPALEERLANTPGDNERVALLQHYLVQQCNKENGDAVLAYCLSQAHAIKDLLPVSQLVNATGISQRQLARKFQQYVGVSPKEYLSVTRFVRALEQLKKYPELSLTQIAYESGYYDQAHFNRDFKNYTGLAPGDVARAAHVLY